MTATAPIRSPVRSIDSSAEQLDALLTAPPSAPLDRHRLDPRHRLRPRPLAQRHGHQLHPGARPRRRQLQLPPQRPGPHPGRPHRLRCSTTPSCSKPAATQIAALIALLDRFIIMDDVELADISDSAHGLLIAGPDAPRTARKSVGTPCSHDSRAAPSTAEPRADWNRGAPVDLIHAYSPLVPRFELWADAETIAHISPKLSARRRSSSRAEALEALRILEGTPRYGTDIRDTTTSRRRPTRPAPSTSPKAATSARRSSSASAPAARSTAPSPASSSTGDAARRPGAHRRAPPKASPSANSPASPPIPLPAGPIQLALGYIRREALDRNAAPRPTPAAPPPQSALPFRHR